MLCGREVRSTARGVIRETLVAAQIAISLTLLTGACLLLRSLSNLQNAPLGLEAQNVLTETISFGAYRYPAPPQQIEFFDELLARLHRLPGRHSHRPQRYASSIRRDAFDNLFGNGSHRTCATNGRNRRHGGLARRDARLFLGARNYHRCAAANSLTKTSSRASTPSF